MKLNSVCSAIKVRKVSATKDHLFGKELFIRFTASAFRKLPSIYVSSYLSLGFVGKMWDLIVSVGSDRCLSFYFGLSNIGIVGTIISW